jgi:hypothetical protein
LNKIGAKKVYWVINKEKSDDPFNTLKSVITAYKNKTIKNIKYLKLIAKKKFKHLIFS